MWRVGNRKREGHQQCISQERMNKLAAVNRHVARRSAPHACEGTRPHLVVHLSFFEETIPPCTAGVTPTTPTQSAPHRSWEYLRSIKSSHDVHRGGLHRPPTCTISGLRGLDGRDTRSNSSGGSGYDTSKSPAGRGVPAVWPRQEPSHADRGANQHISHPCGTGRLGVNAEEEVTPSPIPHSAKSFLSSRHPSNPRRAIT